MTRSASVKRVGVLYSGGLDSAALVAHYLQHGAEVWPVYVRSALPWEKNEVERGQEFLRRLACPQLRPMGIAHLNLENAYRENWSLTGETPGAKSRDEDVFLPLRNLVLITKAMLVLSSEQVYDLAIATLKGNPFPDARPSYFRLPEKVLTAGLRQKVRVHTPFRSKTKADVISALRQFPLHLSFSCIAPRRGLHCGRCNKCAERRRAFVQAGLDDRTRYATAGPKGKARRSS